MSDVDERYQARLHRWATRALNLGPGDVASVEADVVGGCGEGTCEYTTVEITVTLADGRTFTDRRGFGDYLNEILASDLDEDGNETFSWNRPLFKLQPVDGGISGGTE